jgi:putative tricarboxylic transport membrane protein
MKGMVRLLDLPNHYLWPAILIFCVVGTYTTSNNIYTVIVMLVSGVVGVVMKRTGVPAGPVVLGLLLGPLAEANLRRALIIDGPSIFVSRPIALTLLVRAVGTIAAPRIAKLVKRDRGAARAADRDKVGV